MLKAHAVEIALENLKGRLGERSPSCSLVSECATIMELDAQWMCLYLKLFSLKRPLIATQSFVMHVSISRSSCFRSTLMWLLHTKDLLKTGRWFEQDSPL